jgi:hypothetical protein
VSGESICQVKIAGPILLDSLGDVSNLYPTLARPRLISFDLQLVQW